MTLLTSEQESHILVQTVASYDYACKLKPGRTSCSFQIKVNCKLTVNAIRAPAVPVWPPTSTLGCFFETLLGMTAQSYFLPHFFLLFHGQ